MCAPPTEMMGRFNAAILWTDKQISVKKLARQILCLKSNTSLLHGMQKKKTVHKQQYYVQIHSI